MAAGFLARVLVGAKVEARGKLQPASGLDEQLLSQQRLADRALSVIGVPLRKAKAAESAA